ncbi:MAG: YciI family protein [Thermomicrobiales bacterium]
MKYLCLVYHDEIKVAAMPASEYESIMNDVLAYREELRLRGHYLASPAQPVRTAATIRVREGKASITDGPFAAKEQLGGFYLIEARDLNEALRLASEMPPARIGSIEVRALDERH